jgi:16S rRNA (guanine(966)-N(2))-methyltransferase RsmD
MRVIAGTYRSRILKSLKGLALRPTSDRLRETLFNILGAGVSGSRFLDIFAGTGAIGIEALSRGASHVTFVENHPPAVALIRRNLESLQVKSGATIVAADALRALETLNAKKKSLEAPFEYVFVDPPYAAAADYARVLHFLGTSTFLVPGAIVIVEHHHKFNLPEQLGALERVRVLKQGDAALSFFRFGLAAAKENPDFRQT